MEKLRVAKKESTIVKTVVMKQKRYELIIIISHSFVI